MGEQPLSSRSLPNHENHPSVRQARMDRVMDRMRKMINFFSEEQRRNLLSHMPLYIPVEGEYSGTELMYCAVDGGLLRKTMLEHLKIGVVSKTRSESKELESIGEQPETCVICLAEYEDLEQIATLDCGHEYHMKCIGQWLRKGKCCPLCKKAY
ncbi:unnamed protein product [Ilex paraguariensis]|uniref:RING-type E3 ubiquitin transferase n=1 Tax=Ilex paraguariensis TaxID=185542 RepID=A0ABC8R105_9AQUA